MAKRPCARPGCPALVERGYCDACRPKSPAALAEQSRGSASGRGYGRRWQKVRLEYLARHPLCVDPYGVHGVMVVAATEVDHIVPHKGDMTRFWDASNWQGLCKECHSKKTATEDGGFGRPKGCYVKTKSSNQSSGDEWCAEKKPAASRGAGQ
jgi:5-methylcytosine-specific restriction protein A